MDREEYIHVDEEKQIVQFIPGSQSGDEVTISIFRLADNYYWDFDDLEFGDEIQSGTMEWVTDGYWSSSFTPNLAGTYLVYIKDVVLDVDFSVVFNAVEEA